ncbi:MAG: hypothetical protein JXQ68_04200 [Campylobacterales bacterium]|nr:hypothetical protein [Campylobacterales bacterium]
MKTIVKIFSIAILAIILSGCGKSTLDTSSEEAMKKSADKIMTELSAEDQERFQRSIVGIYMYAAITSLGNGENQDEVLNKVNTQMDGKTAEEIFALADELQEKMKLQLGK